MAKNPVRFDASRYVRSHGKQPRGLGSWAFAFGVGTDGPWFAPGAHTLSDAKKLATEEARRRGAGLHPSITIYVDILS